MISQRIWPLAYDHPEDMGSCKWSFGGTGLLQMITRHPCHPNPLTQDPDSISRTFLEQFDLVERVVSIWTRPVRGWGCKGLQGWFGALFSCLPV